MLTIATPQLTGVLETTTDLIAVLDPAFCLVAFNPAYAEASRELLQCPVEIGLNILDALRHVPEHQARARRLWTRVLQGESFTEMVEIFEGTRGRRRVWEVAYYPLRDEARYVIAAVHLAREATDRVHQQEQTRFALEWERMERWQAERQGQRLDSENEALTQQVEQMKQLVSCLRHELHESVHTVLSSGQQLQQQYGPELSGPATTHLASMILGAERLRALLESFLPSVPALPPS